MSFFSFSQSAYIAWKNTLHHKFTLNPIQSILDMHKKNIASMMPWNTTSWDFKIDLK